MQAARNFLLLILTITLSALAVAQDSATYKPPRTEHDHPDLQGVWTIATLTNLERGQQFGGLIVPPEQTALFEQTVAAANAEADQAIDPDRPAPEAGAGVGGYNRFWMDPGSQLARIDGQARSSIIVMPENGRLPWSEDGLQALRWWGERPALDGPEMRTLGERCMVGFGSSGGPPMLPVLYNNHSQIVQTADYVMILAEMNHDARIIRLRDTHLPDTFQPWMGDSIGWYEGDTLVVETTNFHPQQSYRFSLRHRLYLSPDTTVTERFTRVAEDQILYSFAVDDPKTYTQVWQGELPMRRVEDRMYEYACHEGNYSLPGILAAARLEDAQQADR
ncbi:MAG: hypothetical protein RQ757_04760 [Pseudomonadales bacterium]|nr:hypothetical protein [Pseudomonadales bacterium]